MSEEEECFIFRATFIDENDRSFQEHIIVNTNYDEAWRKALEIVLRKENNRPILLRELIYLDQADLT